MVELAIYLAPRGERVRKYEGVAAKRRYGER